jgi:hypothetical protein
MKATLLLLALFIVLGYLTRSPEQESQLRDAQQQTSREDPTRSRALERMAQAFQASVPRMRSMLEAEVIPSSVAVAAFTPAEGIAIKCLRQAGGSEELGETLRLAVARRMLACLDRMLPREPK